MPPSLNLSPLRGPSVWDRIDRQSKLDRLGALLVSAGAAASAVALLRGRGRPWTVGLTFAVMTAGLLCQGRSWTPPAAFKRRSAADDAIDRASADSFPASDPPSNSRGGTEPTGRRP